MECTEIENKQQRKTSEIKIWLFEYINKSDEPLARLIKKKRENTQISEIKDKTSLQILQTLIWHKGILW